MNREEIFAAWAPEEPDDEFGPAWTSWAKPVLFAELSLNLLPPRSQAAPAQPDGITFVPPAPAATQLSRAPWDLPGPAAPGVAAPSKPEPIKPVIENPAALLARLSGGLGRSAIVVDLPGERAVRWGIALAKEGYRPVPLFNGCSGPAELIEMASLSAALRESAAELRDVKIDHGAPPAFLLDSRRLSPVRPPSPGLFDNRWLTLPQDFPSANLLLARRLESAIVIQSAGHPQNDLSHVLRRWQEAGMRIQLWAVDSGGVPEAHEVRRPSSFRGMWYRLGALMGLRPNSAGGFGGIVPQPSASSG